MYFPKPMDTIDFTWTPAYKNPPADVVTLEAEKKVPGWANSKYYLYQYNANHTLVHLVVEVKSADGTETTWFPFSGKILTAGSTMDIPDPKFVRGDSEDPIKNDPMPDPGPIGGACASRRMLDATINGRPACVSLYYYPSYAARLAVIVAAGAIAGRVINKKKRKKGTIVGALVGGGIATILALTGALRPSFVYKE